MNETFYSTGGLRRITRLPPVVNVRLVMFALAVGLGVLVVLWLQAGIGRQMVHLEAEFAALQAEAFYVGVQTRIRVRQLNDRLLAFLLNRQPAEREAFRTDSAELKRWFSNMERRLATDQEREVFDALERDYDFYLSSVEALLPPADGPAERAAFVDFYLQIEKQTRPLLRSAGRLIAAQQQAFNDFLQTSQDTLLSLHRLLNLSLGLLLAAGGALAVLLYRGMVTPLRRRLSASQAIIERQEKLAALGTLAAGVAHEIRNPLTALKFRLFSFKKALPPEFADHEDAAVISTEINRLDRIVKEFLQFARPADPVLARVPADRLLQDVAALLRPELEKSAIALQLEPAGSAWVQVDTQQIKQVLINLMQNAADSIGRNGQITLRATPGTANLSGRVQSAVLLSVADTGPGIPPEVEERLFDPFFSTKENGTGLGLAIAARIVEKHGGVLRYRTVLKRGTTFEVVLPKIKDHASETADH